MLHQLNLQKVQPWSMMKVKTSFRVSQLEKNMGNMEQRMEKKLEESMEKNMGNMEKRMEKKLEENMERIFNLLQHTEEKITNGDNVGQDRKSVV